MDGGTVSVDCVDMFSSDVLIELPTTASCSGCWFVSSERGIGLVWLVRGFFAVVGCVSCARGGFVLVQFVTM